MADNIQDRAKTSAQSAEKAVDKVKVNRSLAKPIPKGLQDMEGGPGPSKGTGAMKPPFELPEGLQNMEGGPGASEGVGSNPSVRLVVDSSGKASYINPATGETTEVPGTFSKLVDIFHQLSGNVKEVAGNAVNKAKGLLTDTSTEAEKTMKAAKGFGKDLGKGAMKAAGKDLTSRVLANPMTKFGPEVGAFLAMMEPTAANAGEADALRRDEMKGMGTPSDAGAPSDLESNLDNQSQAVLDKGINTASKPTVELDKGPDPRPKTDVGAAMPQAATMVDNHTGRLGVDTGGGFFPVYNKNSGEASDFRSSFAKAVASGLPTFQWQGREYTTEIKKDQSSNGSPGTI